MFVPPYLGLPRQQLLQSCQFFVHMAHTHTPITHPVTPQEVLLSKEKLIDPVKTALRIQELSFLDQHPRVLSVWIKQAWKLCQNHCSRGSLCRQSIWWWQSNNALAKYLHPSIYLANDTCKVWLSYVCNTFNKQHNYEFSNVFSKNWYTFLHYYGIFNSQWSWLLNLLIHQENKHTSYWLS